MPQIPPIPTYDNPTVGIAPVATPQATPLGPAAFGAGLGAGMQDVSKALDVMATHYNHAKVLDGLNRATDAWQQLAHDQTIDPDTGQPNGYLLRQGTAANGLEQEFHDDMRENLDDIRSGLDNDMQRAAFDQIISKKMDVWNTAVNEHEYKQNMAQSALETNASVNLSLNGIAQDFQNPDLVSNYIDTGVKSIVANAVLNGQDPNGGVVRNMVLPVRVIGPQDGHRLPDQDRAGDHSLELLQRVRQG